MSRLGRIRRRPDHWATPHDRARTRAAERLDGPLGLTEATWLDEHLAACPDCAAVAAAYDADRLGLRAMRGVTPEPPRDLWARTSAAIERESVARGRSPRPASQPGRRLPLGVLSGVAVIAVVVGASLLSGGWLGSPTPQGMATVDDPSATPESITASAAIAAVPTPFVVGAGNVAWLRAGPDGTFYGNAAVERVCPAGGAAGCANVDAKQERLDLDLASAPRSVIGSPTDRQAVVVGDDGSGGDQLLVMALPDGAASTPDPTEEAPTTTPTPTATPAPGATGTPAPTDDPAATAEPTPEATPDASPSVVPSPEPTVAAALAIAKDVVVMGESAAFSPDGRWFAFTAMPADGSSGPDIWVWRVGAPTATPLTDDGAHVFASWAGSTVVGSTPASTTPTDDGVEPVTLLIDPSSGEATPIEDAVWRPIVAPGGERAVTWTGTVRPSDEGAAWVPAKGRLQLRPWTATGEAGTTEVQDLADGAPADFDVRWDDTGEWFALWVAETADAEIGRLSLFHVDPETGEVSQPDGAPDAAAALPGFSIGEGRLAWATPRGQGGEGSRIQIVAWDEGAVGSVETVPGEDLVVVR
jgi:hypothetical protein